MYLEKEDVSLYYEVRGEGEPLLLIHGIIVDAGLFEEAADILSNYYRVVTFDRRGNSRSVLKREEKFSMEAQIEDVRDLLDHLGIYDCYIFGASAGGAVGSYFLEKYPDRVRHLIMYEPAMLGLMKREESVRKFVDEITALVEKRKYSTAILKFAYHINSFDNRGKKKHPEAVRREMGNHQYALTAEFPGLVEHKPDMEKWKKYADNITFAVGDKSGDTVYSFGPRVMAEELGRKPFFYPGCHNFPYDLPLEFAINIHGTFQIEELRKYKNTIEAVKR